MRDTAVPLSLSVAEGMATLPKAERAPGPRRAPSLDLKRQAGDSDRGRKRHRLGHCPRLDDAGAKVHVCDVNEALLSAMAKTDPRNRHFDGRRRAIRFRRPTVRRGAGRTRRPRHPRQQCRYRRAHQVLEEITDEEWRETVDVNLTGQFYCTASRDAHCSSRPAADRSSISRRRPACSACRCAHPMSPPNGPSSA